MSGHQHPIFGERVSRFATPKAGLRTWLILAALVALAALVRFYGLDREPLWLDEGYSWWDAQQSLHDLWNLVPQCDPHPPLYFVLLKMWIALFGDGALAMRGLSAIIGIVTMVVVFFAGREISARTGWIAGLLFAIAPFQIYFAHEARPYALLCLGAALVLFGALRVVRTMRQAEMGVSAQSGPPVSVRLGWLAVIVGSAIVLWANNTSVLMLVSLGGALALLGFVDPQRSRVIKPAIFAGIVVALLWAPYIPVLLEQARGVSSDFWIQPPNLWRATEEFSYLVGFGNGTAAWWMIALMACGLMLLVRYGARRQALMLLALAVVPVLLNIGVSLSVKPIFISRALIGVTPAFVVALAAGLALMRSASLRGLMIVALVAVHGIGTMGLLDATHTKEPWNDVAATLMRDVKPAGSNAAVLVVANEMALPLRHALDDLNAAVPIHGIPANFPSPGMTARYPSGKCAPSVTGLDLNSVKRLVQGRQEVVLITRRHNSYDPDNRVHDYLVMQGWKQTSSSFFNPGDLQIYQFAATGRTGLPLIVDAPHAEGSVKLVATPVTKVAPTATGTVGSAPATTALTAPVITH